MTPVLSTTTWVLHDLGLATGFGGALYGKAALQPAVKAISSTRERHAVVALAWKDFSVFNAISLATIAGTWFIGRPHLSGREIDGTTRALVIAKDALIGAAVATGVGSMVTGLLGDRAQHAASDAGGLGVATGRSAPLRTASGVLGYVNLAAIAGAIGVTAALAMKAGRPNRWSFLSRLLP
jgi:hypothetical protein